MDGVVNRMTANAAKVYWFNSASGEIYLSEEQLPQNKRQLYLVINRETLYFGKFSLHSKKRVKDSDVLNIQGHFVPFKSDFMNFIYGTEKQKQQEKHFFFWVGPLPSDLNVESFFYDEIPESLMFKGNPETVKNYNLFVFKRVSGYEIIYFNVHTYDFYSIFEKEAAGVAEKIALLMRKFAVGIAGREEKVKILTECDIPSLHRLRSEGNYTFDVDLIKSEDDRTFFFPDFFPVEKKFSNLSQSKQIKSIKTIGRQWARNLTIIMLLLLLVILLNVWGFIQLKKDNTQLKHAFAEIGEVLTTSETIEFRLNKIKKKISQYPDHMLYLKTISRCMDADSVLIGYSLGDGRILIEGYSPDSLGLLTCLRQSNQFQDVRFKTTVTKNVYSQREKFEIEMLLRTPGTGAKPAPRGKKQDNQ
ncbi:MAG: PilN domain-containing protein [Candidatus Aminicenantes bacterium]|nr:MAG: PilN domain-containing protein [Candidatus Aminicenantes bacterium]